jgi:capsular polysaccharide biosynthesis protein
MSSLPVHVDRMSEEALDLRRLLTAITRRRLLFTMVLAGCLAVGVLVAVLQTPTFASRATVLLPPSDRDANGNELRDMATELTIVMSSEILGRAGRAAGSDLELDELQRAVSVQAVSNEVFEIHATAASPEQAAQLADAVATEYVAFSIDEASERVGTQISALKDQTVELEERIERLDAEIASNIALLRSQDPGSAEALRTAAIIDSLRLDQVDAARQLSSVNTRVADAELSAALSRRGTRVLEAATVPDQPMWLRRALPVAIAGATGLLLGALLAFARNKRDRRIRARDEVAEAVGAPVVASLPVPRSRGVNGCSALLRGWTASPTERLALRHAFTRLSLADLGTRTNLIVIVLPADRAGVLLAAQLAAFAAAGGTRTAFALCSDEPTAADVRAACNSLKPLRERLGPDRPVGTEEEGIIRPDLCFHDLGAEAEVVELDCAELTVVVVVADMGGFVIPTGRGATATAIAVSSGWATPEELASVAALCQDAGHRVGGVFLANPDRRDTTTGDVGPRAKGAIPRVATKLSDVRTESA